MNSPKDSNRFSKWWATQGGVLKRVNTKNPTEKARAEKDISTREKAITNLYEREFLGQSNTGIGSESALAQNFANGMFRYASFGYFALNIGSAIKNAIGPKIQGAIMSAGGEYMTGRSYAKGEKWSFNTMFELSFGLYKAAPASMNVQLMEIMDIIPDRLQNKFGERISRTLTRDAANMGWLYNFRKWTESQSAGFGQIRVVEIDCIFAGIERQARFARAGGITNNTGLTDLEAVTVLKHLPAALAIGGA